MPGGLFTTFSYGGPETASVRYRSNGSLGSCPVTLIHRVTALHRAFIQRFDYAMFSDSMGEGWGGKHPSPPQNCQLRYGFV